VTLIAWLRRNFTGTAHEEKKAEARAAKMRAMQNLDAASAILEDATPEQLDQATECLRSISTSLKGDTERLLKGDRRQGDRRHGGHMTRTG
jgi:hypothetical protein